MTVCSDRLCAEEKALRRPVCKAAGRGLRAARRPNNMQRLREKQVRTKVRQKLWSGVTSPAAEWSKKDLPNTSGCGSLASFPSLRPSPCAAAPAGLAGGEVSCCCSDHVLCARIVYAHRVTLNPILWIVLFILFNVLLIYLLNMYSEEKVDCSSSRFVTRFLSMSPLSLSQDQLQANLDSLQV